METTPKPKRRVLVVDDEPAVANVMEMMLRFEGHEAQTVPDAHAALELLEHNSFDFVITDYLMPVMKGDELAVTIKQRWPKQPVIMLSAHAEMLKSSGKKLPGVDALINKPFLLADLRNAMVESMAKG